MKKSILQIVLIYGLFIIVAFAIVGCQAATKRTGLVIFGDSIGEGVTYTTPEESVNEENQGYAKKLSHRLQGTTKYHNLTLSNHSVTGHSSRDLLLLLDNEDVKTSLRNATFIVINIGGNNLAQVLNNMPTDVETLANIQKAAKPQLDFFKNLGASIEEGLRSFEQEWPQIIKKIRAQNEKAPIYALTQYNPFVDTNVLERQVGALADSYIIRLNNVINDSHLMDQFQYQVVDIYDIYEKSGRKPDYVKVLLTDQYPDVHPTDAGHEAIAAAVFDAIVTLNMN